MTTEQKEKIYNQNVNSDKLHERAREYEWKEAVTTCDTFEDAYHEGYLAALNARDEEVEKVKKTADSALQSWSDQYEELRQNLLKEEEYSSQLASEVLHLRAELAKAQNPWHKMEELPKLDPAMASRGFNMSLPVLLCDIDYLTCYNGARFHYDPARYDFDKKQWVDIIGYYDEEIGITHTHWMYEPEPPKGGMS